MTDWTYFAKCVNERFGPPTKCNPLGELTALRKTCSVDDYTKRFLAHVTRVGHLDEIQQVNIYTAGLLEPLKTDVELLNPQYMETAMSLARSYERPLAVVAESNKAQIGKPGHLPPPRPTTAQPTATAHTPTTTGTTIPSTRPFKHLTTEEMAERRQQGLCFNCDEPFSRNHKYKMLFEITAVNDHETEEGDASLMMMIGRLQSGVQGASLMYLEGIMNGTDVLVLVDSDSTHNVIDISIARTIGLREQRIDTTILVGSGNSVPCRGASFNVPLRIGSDIFDIDTFLLDVGNDIDIILGTPWLATLGRVTWDFTDMELRYLRNGRYHILHPVQRRQTSTTVQPL
jgi:hypothetical protein